MEPKERFTKDYHLVCHVPGCGHIMEAYSATTLAVLVKAHRALHQMMAINKEFGTAKSAADEQTIGKAIVKREFPLTKADKDWLKDLLVAW
jgi:hypothetical protein